VPILLAVLAGFFLGVAAAWLARAELGRIDAPIIATRPFYIVTGFAVFVYTPIFGYFVAFHGDWTYGYLVAWRRVPSAIDLALVLLAGASVLLGMAAAAPAARSRRLPVVAWLGIAPGAVFAIVLGMGARRLAVSASYAQYHGGFGVVPISSSALGKGVLAMAIVLTAGIVWTVRALSQATDPHASLPLPRPRTPTADL
jgi:hypothetical protein